MTRLQYIKSKNVWPAIKIGLIYATVGALWVLLSDRVLAYFTTDMQVLTQIQTFKGWAFILVTAILIFFLVHRKLIEIGKLNAQLQHRVNTLESFLPICANCKKIRKPDSDPKTMDSWEHMETYISKRTSSTFSHGICPECMEELYGDELRKK